MISRPQRTRTEHLLPFDRLSPAKFEELCLGLIMREGYDDVQHLGAAGGEQGRDIVAFRAGRPVAFQCKRVGRFTPANAEKELEKVFTLPASERPAEYVFLVTSNVSALTRRRAQELAGTMVCRFWALTELDQHVRKYPDLVEKCFGSLGTAADDELRQIRRLLDEKTSKLPPNAPPSKVLTADYEVIPFDEAGRREELELLASYCDGEQSQGVLLLMGEGGTGKTRLLIEWCRRLRAQGWHAGFLRSDRQEPDLDPLLEGSAPRLVVVDYADARLQVVKQLLLKAGLAPEEGPKVRIVLLARRAGVWWDSLKQERAIEDLLLNSLPPRQLTPLVPDPGDRLLAFRSAAGAFADRLGWKLPENLATPDLAAPTFERALYLHMAALAALEGERVESARDALGRTLNRERRFWGYYIGELGLDEPRRRQMEKAIESAVAVLTFLGKTTYARRARGIVSHVLEALALTPDLEARLFEMLEDLYGGHGEEGNRFLEPLQPDLLGEQLVVERWAEDAVLWQELFLAASAGMRNRDAIHGPLTLLTRLAKRHPESAKRLITLLRDQGETLVSATFDVAVETGDPIGRIFAEILEDEDFILLAQSMILAAHERYHRSIPLREVALVATSRVLEILKTRWGQPNEEQAAELARLSINLGQCLRDVGRLEEALQVTREAVNSYREFTRRDRDAYLPHLASGLTNLGTLQSELGQREEALEPTREALQIYRQLAQGFKDYRAKLATCIDNQANRLAELGRYEEALQTAKEGLQICRELVAEVGQAFLPDLAHSLSNLGAHLKAAGLNQDAVSASREAVEIWRELAEQRPDTFLPDLAVSLNNCGALLADLGQQEESLAIIEEAVGIWRRLVKDRPAAFLSGLAEGLENLGIVLSDLGRHEEARQALIEALATYRQLVETRPDVFAPKLAQVLSSLSNVLSEVGQVADALHCAQTAEAHWRRLARQRPNVFLSNLAGCLANLGNRLAEAGRGEDALRVAQEAVGLYRQLSQERPGVFAPNLAKAAMNLGNRFREGGQSEKAREITMKAVALYRELAAQSPDAFLPELARCLNNLGLQLRDDKEGEDSRLCFEEAIRLLTPFLLRRPAGFLPWMRVIVKNYREILHELGRAPDEELIRPLRGHLQDEV